MIQQNPLIYFDLSLGRYGDGTPLGRVVVELKEDVVPKTAKNFLGLAESRQAGNGYKGSRAHRIIPGTASTFSWYPLHWYVPNRLVWHWIQTLYHTIIQGVMVSAHLAVQALWCKQG